MYLNFDRDQQEARTPIFVSIPGAFSPMDYPNSTFIHCNSLLDIFKDEKILCAAVFIMEENMAMVLNKYTDYFVEGCRVIGVADTAMERSTLHQLNLDVIDVSTFEHIVLMASAGTADHVDEDIFTDDEDGDVSDE